MAVGVLLQSSKLGNWGASVIADAVSESKKAVSVVAAAIVFGIGLLAALLQ